MNFLKKMWAGVKSGFNWIKKHKVVSFLVGGTLIGTGIGMALGFGLLPSLLGGAAATLGLFAVGGAVFGAGVLVGGLVLLAAMGIGHLFGIGKKKDKEANPPAVAPADPTQVNGVDCPAPEDGIAPTPITDASQADGTLTDGPGALGETDPLAPVAVNDLDLATTGQRGQLNGAAPGSQSTGFSSVMTGEAPIEPLPDSLPDMAPTAIAPVTGQTADRQLPPEARTLNMPLGEPVLK